eukprot:GEMP01032394.1.p1 GENE.GEMP01032394.1~~GEMP01032394.1.p1  ORF type:complete len:231 (+),score=27.20 GEMP01032394.1:186-878(+)
MARHINHDGLARLSSAMKHLDLGERIIRMKIELFSALRPERRMSDKLDLDLQSSPAWLAESPIGPLSRPQTKQLLLQLIQTMNFTFPDSDYSNLTPEHFSLCPDFPAVAQVINSSLFGVERIYQGFHNDFWSTLRDCVNFDHVDIYTFNPEVDAEYSSLGQFHYFFYDKLQKRILMLSSVLRSKFPGFNSESSDMSDRIDSSSQSSRQSAEMFVGEYDFAPPNSDDDMDN